LQTTSPPAKGRKEKGGVKAFTFHFSDSIGGEKGKERRSLPHRPSRCYESKRITKKKEEKGGSSFVSLKVLLLSKEEKKKGRNFLGLPNPSVLKKGRLSNATQKHFDGWMYFQGEGGGGGREKGLAKFSR